MNHRRQGMFNNAKFSERVFNNLPERVARGVRKDLEYIFKRTDDTIEQRQWNRVPPMPALESPNLLRIATPKRKRPAAAIQNEQSDQDETLFHLPHSKKKKKLHQSQLLDPGPSERPDETPTVLRSPPKNPAPTTVLDEEVFPKNIDTKVLANSILAGLPHLPLHNHTSKMYSTATVDIFRSSLKRFFQEPEDLSDFANSTFQTSSEISINNSICNIDPGTEMMNQTAPFNVSRRSSLKSEDYVNDEEPFTLTKTVECSFNDASFDLNELVEINKQFADIDRTLQEEESIRSFFNDTRYESTSFENSAYESKHDTSDPDAYQPNSQFLINFEDDEGDAFSLF